MKPVRSDNVRDAVAPASRYTLNVETFRRSRPSFTRPLALVIGLGAGLGAVFATSPAFALELGLDASALQLPSDGWFRTSLSIDVAVPIGAEAAVTAVGGAAAPYSIGGYTQQISFGALLGEWRPDSKGWLQPLIGAGLGGYLDQVGDSGGWVPSLVTRAGIRIGKKTGLGFHAGFECHAGIYSTEQLSSYVIWPMSRVTGGLHVRF